MVPSQRYCSVVNYLFDGSVCSLVWNGTDPSENEFFVSQKRIVPNITPTPERNGFNVGCSSFDLFESSCILGVESKTRDADGPQWRCAIIFT